MAKILRIDKIHGYLLLEIKCNLCLESHQKDVKIQYDRNLKYPLLLSLTWAATFPLPILRSARTTITILYCSNIDGACSIYKLKPTIKIINTAFKYINPTLSITLDSPWFNGLVAGEAPERLLRLRVYKTPITMAPPRLARHHAKDSKSSDMKTLFRRSRLRHF